MIFQSETHYTWDTWMFCHGGTYYLYYLITDNSPGEGFGVAVSRDGVHYRDYGQRLFPSNKMVVYLGTGAVWESPSFVHDGIFYCNYSEWRKDESSGENVQNILFAKSQNLIDWDKLGDECMFCVDSRNYVSEERKGGRWDCIFPVKTDKGYSGYFTATPKHYFGCGYGETEDGVHWRAGEPPEFELAEKGVKDGIEVGGVCRYKGKYYLLMGTYVNRYGMAVMVGDTPNGKFMPQKKNFALLSNESFRHAYFMRLFERNGELFVNHHALTRRVNRYDRPQTYLSPIKRVVFDGEDILRLKWFEDNECLKGEKTENPDFENGCVIEGKLSSEYGVTLFGKEHRVEIKADLQAGKFTLFENGALRENIEKDMPFSQGRFRLLYRDTLLELYVDDYFITCYTVEKDMNMIRSSFPLHAWKMTV